MKIVSQAFAAIALLSAAAAACAQSWPSKPVKLINPFPAGGGTDTFARPLAAKIGTGLGQPIIVENLGGVAARSAPPRPRSSRRTATRSLWAPPTTQSRRRSTPSSATT